MWVRAKTLLLLLSLALNVPFIALWAARTVEPTEPERRESTAPPTMRRVSTPNAATPRGLSPRAFSSGRSENTRAAYRDVGVTDEQWYVIEPRLTQFRAAMFRVNRELKQERDELVDLIAAPDLDYGAIRAKQEEIVEAHRRIGELLTDNMLADREVLTPEQQAKFFKKLRDYCGPSATSPVPTTRPSSYWIRPKPQAAESLELNCTSTDAGRHERTK